MFIRIMNTVTLQFEVRMSLFIYTANTYRNNIRKRYQKKRHAEKEQIQEEIKTQNLQEKITTFHLRQYAQIDWNNMVSEIAPLKPKLEKHYELMLNKKWEQFEFGVFHRLIGIETLARTTLNLFMSEARNLDDQQFQEELQEYQSELQEWENGLKIGMGIQKKDATVYQKALEHLLAFHDITETGFQIVMKDCDSTLIFFDVSVPSKTLIYSKCFPNTFTPTDLIEEENTLFEQCVGSAIVSILIDTFAILPIENVRVDIQCDETIAISPIITCSKENVQKYNALETMPLEFLRIL